MHYAGCKKYLLPLFNYSICAGAISPAESIDGIRKLRNAMHIKNRKALPTLIQMENPDAVSKSYGSVIVVPFQDDYYISVVERKYISS